MASRGRLNIEPESQTRSMFQRDRDRIIHSGAFRRLKYKTQVFVYHEGDHYRTRLTHSLEVAQIARSLARALNVNEDIAEALALAHDLGHPPFGHAGEEALQEVMKPFGGFDHNGHALRIVTKLEARYADFNGLNLSWETLEGLAKHNGPLISDSNDFKTLPWAIAEYNSKQDLELHSQPGIEAQIAALSDDIAYNTHDIDDGLRAKFFSVNDLINQPVVGPLIKEVYEKYPGLEQSRLIHETTRRMINQMVNDLLLETKCRLKKLKPKNALEIRSNKNSIVSMSKEMKKSNEILKTFLLRKMYRHHRINRMTNKAKQVIQDLFNLFLSNSEFMPMDWQKKVERINETSKARIVTDYIAGMTDRFALEEHRRQFSLYE